MSNAPFDSLGYRFDRTLLRRSWRPAIALGSVGVALGLGLVLNPAAHPLPDVMLYWMAIMLCTWYGGRAVGLLATATAALAMFTFQIDALYLLETGERRGFIPLALLLAGGGALTFLCAALRSARGRDHGTRRPNLATAPHGTRGLDPVALTLGPAPGNGARAHWDWDVPAGTLTWDTGLAYFGHRAATLDRRTEVAFAWWCEHIHPRDRRRVVDGLQAAIVRGDARWETELELRAADGLFSVLHAEVDVERDAAGGLQHVRCALRDGSLLPVSAPQ